jgi:hypothetical protein
VLVFALQGSGAALVAYALAQKPGAVGLVDLWAGKAPPTPAQLALKPGTSDVILKVPIATADLAAAATAAASSASGGGNGGSGDNPAASTTTSSSSSPDSSSSSSAAGTEASSSGTGNSGGVVDLQRYVDLFQPDLTVLVLRHPAVNLASLNSKGYRDAGGSLEDKARALEKAFVDSFMATHSSSSSSDSSSSSSSSSFSSSSSEKDDEEGTDGVKSQKKKKKSSLFDEVVLYEDLVLGIDSLATTTASPSSSSPSSPSLSHPSLRRLFTSLGVTSPQHQTSMLEFPRSVEEVSGFAVSQCGWCASQHRKVCLVG